MKRFIVFAGNRYYPDGGWHDLKGSFDTESEAWAFIKTHCEEEPYRWGHFVDTQTEKVTVCVTCWGE